MPSPLTVKRNDYHERPKRSDVYTPPGVASFLFGVLQGARPLRGKWVLEPSQEPTRGRRVLDPAIGSGRLTDPWHAAGFKVVGFDIVDKKPKCRLFRQTRYEDVESVDPEPGLVLCNPPFNGAEGKRLYPEVFLEHTFKLLGVHQPVALFAPMGMRLNQRCKSARWRWLRDCGAQLTSIISLPLDVFPGVEFHAEVLIFNLRGVKPHYFLPESVL
jgi:type I restriction enzyme M protein